MALETKIGRTVGGSVGGKLEGKACTDLNGKE
jgi:hypothetical protein